MTERRRNRNSARRAGARFNSEVASYLAKYLHDDRIEPRHPKGAKDTGDLAGIRLMDRRFVGECKDYGGVYHVGPWLNETEVERVNDEALAGVCFAKRRGTADMGKQVVLMSMADFVALVTGARPEVD